MIYREVGFEQFKAILEREPIVVVPIYKSSSHHVSNQLSAVVFFRISNSSWHTLSFDHPDLEKSHSETMLSLISPLEVYALDGRYLNRYWDDVYDLDVYFWFYCSREMARPKNPARIYQRRGVIDIGHVVPMTKWVEFGFEVFNSFMEVYQPLEKSLVAYFRTVCRPLISIEYNGIQIRPEGLERFKRCRADDRIYGFYKFTTTTGRPSNSYGGTNFVAFPKEDGSRSYLIPTAENGYLVEYDFDAYHIRLIANLIGFDLGAGNVHNLFGEQYFGTANLSEAQYAESKRITFLQLYSDSYEYANPYFDAVKSFKQLLWDRFNVEGYLELPETGRKIRYENYPEITPNKLFNYFLQGVETEHSMKKLGRLNDFLSDKKSKIVLYVYDSFLLDFDPIDGKETLKKVREILSLENTPVKIKAGKDYHTLKQVSDPE